MSNCWDPLNIAGTSSGCSALLWSAMYRYCCTCSDRTHLLPFALVHGELSKFHTHIWTLQLILYLASLALCKCMCSHSPQTFCDKTEKDESNSICKSSCDAEEEPSRINIAVSMALWYEADTLCSRFKNILAGRWQRHSFMQINTHILQLYNGLDMISVLHKSQLHSLCHASAMFQILVSLIALPGVDTLGSSWAA